jgi:predicted nucleic acid-binding protein
MIYSSRFIAVLDACVLYPMPIRDLLLHLANLHLYKPKWTEQIQNEWKRNLLINRPDLQEQQLQRTIQEMNKAFPDAEINNYQTLISSIELPDADDRHVLAAAIRCKADVIVTSNLKDFPNEYLTLFDVEAQHPDHFICNLIDLNPEKAMKAFQNQVAYLRNPPMTALRVLEKLRNTGLQNTTRKLESMI